jgi:uncharacterized protein YjbI with pentapeptide repeats
MKQASNFGRLSSSGDRSRDSSDQLRSIAATWESKRMFRLSAYSDFPVYLALYTVLTIMAAGFILRLRQKAVLSRNRQSGNPLAETPVDPGQLEQLKRENLRRIEQGTLPLDLGRADLSTLNLEAASLREAEMSHANLEGTMLARAQMSGARLLGASLENADLSLASLHKADLCFANLRRAVLRDADLSCACLRESQLDEADLSGADLTGASLTGAFLKGAHLSGVVLSDAQLAEINTLFDARLDSELADRVSQRHPHLLVDPVELFWKHHKLRLATMLNARQKRAAQPVELKRFSVPIQGI